MPNSNPVSSNVKIGDHSVMFEGSERYAKTPVAAKSVVTGNPDPDRPKESLASRRESKPVVRYAPLVYLHPEEEFFPATCEFFINNSELIWRHDSGCPSCRIAKKGEVDAAMLGSGGYKHRTRTSPFHWRPCAHTGDEYTSKQPTGPGRGIVGGEGFYLELDDSSRAGQGITSSVYYDYKQQRYIIYWFFYCNNKKSLDRHEGDWENITVRLNGKNEATEVAYNAHGAPKIYKWGEINHYGGTHPIVYSAKGSHASYPKEGTYPTLVSGVQDSAKKGKIWRTWAHLRYVRHMPWFGYGGSWGHVGKLLIGRSLPGPLGEAARMTTGPTGPSLKKPPPGW